MSWKRGKIKRQQMKRKHNKGTVIQYCLKWHIIYYILTKNEKKIYYNFVNHHNSSVVYPPIIVRLQDYWSIIVTDWDLTGDQEGFCARASSELRPPSQGRPGGENCQHRDQGAVRVFLSSPPWWPTNWSSHSTGSGETQRERWYSKYGQHFLGLFSPL